MLEHTKVSRKTTNEDRIAICPQLGCITIKKVKPLKFGFFGFGKYPKCKHHDSPLVYVNERIGEIVEAALACLFDKAGLPPKVLLVFIKNKFPKEFNSFIKSWVYSITIGRGASIISSYMDSLSNSYLKQITKKQLKALKEDTNTPSGRKRGKVVEMIKRGIDEIVFQYTRLLTHLRAHSEVLINVEELLPFSTGLRNAMKAWLEVSTKEETELLEIDEKQKIPLYQLKGCYDKILNLGTCRCILGLPPIEKNINKKRISSFDRFSAYLDFWKENITEKFTRSDIDEVLDGSNNLKRVNQQKNQGVLIINAKIKGIIYTITNLINKKVYIGQTQQKLSKRWSQHKSSAKTGETTPLYNSMRFHGIINFKIEKIEEVPIEFLDDKEIEYIKHFKSNIQEYGNKYGYNQTAGGAGQKNKYIEKIILRDLILQGLKRDQICQELGVSKTALYTRLHQLWAADLREVRNILMKSRIKELILEGFDLKIIAQELNMSRAYIYDRLMEYWDLNSIYEVRKLFRKSIIKDYLKIDTTLNYIA